jgi:ribosomal subunit interface protein
VEVTVSARHIDVTPALRAAAEAKLGRLLRFRGDLERAEVHFVEEQNPRISAREVCEVTVECGGGRRLRAKAAAADAFAAIDLVVEKLSHQLQTAKTKVERRRHALPLGLALAGFDDS